MKSCVIRNRGRACYTSGVKLAVAFCLSLVFLLASLDSALADYVLSLKNGRRITVQSYREERGIIKFRALGGEIGIDKNEIQSIEKTGAPAAGEEASESQEPVARPAVERSPEPGGTQIAPPERELSPEEERAKEEKEYQQKLSDMTRQLKQVRDQYSESLRGKTGPDPSLLTTEEEIKRLNDDANARRLDAQANPVDPGVLNLQTASPFSSLPPVVTENSARRPLEAQQQDFSTPAGNQVVAPAPQSTVVDSPSPGYTDRQKELSDLRNQALQLEQQRQKLIEEMREKNLNTGSLFLE